MKLPLSLWTEEMWAAHLEAESRGLGTLVRIGSDVEWLPCRTHADMAAQTVEEAASLVRGAQARLIVLVREAAGRGESMLSLARRAGMDRKTLSRMVA